MVVAACGSSSSNTPQLTLVNAQRVLIACLPAPDTQAGVPRWDSPIGFYGGIYYNQSSVPVTVESALLLDPHNLTLHGAAIYKMPHFDLALPYEWAWGQERIYDTTAQWAAIRHPIPGAIIPPENRRIFRR